MGKYQNLETQITKEFLYKKLVLMKARQLSGDFNFFELCSKEFNDEILKGKKVLFFIPSPTDDDFLRRVPYRWRETCLFMRNINICPDCAKNMNLLSVIESAYFSKKVTTMKR